MPITLTTPIVRNMPIPTLVSITKVDIKDVHFKVDKSQIVFKIFLTDAGNTVRMYEDYTIEGEDYNTFITATNPTQKIGTSIKRLLLQYLTNKGIFSGTVS